MRLDERLLEDSRNTFRLMRQLGFNETVIWGMYVANNWPVDIRSVVTPEQGMLVERLIAEAGRLCCRQLAQKSTECCGRPLGNLAGRVV
jgi:hypothetical protein